MLTWVICDMRSPGIDIRPIRTIDGGQDFAEVFYYVRHPDPGEVAAIFEVGLYDFDKAFVIMPMEDAQTLLMLGDDVGMIEVQSTDPDRINEILAPLEPVVRGRGVIVGDRHGEGVAAVPVGVGRVHEADRPQPPPPGVVARARRRLRPEQPGRHLVR